MVVRLRLLQLGSISVIVPNPLVVPGNLLQHGVSKKRGLKVLFIDDILDVEQGHEAGIIGAYSGVAGAFERAVESVTAGIPVYTGAVVRKAKVNLGRR